MDLSISNKRNIKPELKIRISHRKQIDSEWLGYTQTEKFLFLSSPSLKQGMEKCSFPIHFDGKLMNIDT